jgi:hypothetical protein
LPQRTSRYDHTKQFKRLRRTLNRQRTVLELVMREVRREMVNLHFSHNAEIRLGHSARPCAEAALAAAKSVDPDIP